MTDTLTTQQRIAQILDDLDFQPETTATPKALGMDSLDFVEFLIVVEKEFAISVPDATAAELNDLPITSMITYIESLPK